MTPDDDAQLPIERLTALLLRRVREDAALALRSAANDDDMASRIAGLPAMRMEPEPLPPLALPGPATSDDLEALVAAALESANDAAEVAYDASEATRRTRRTVMVALAVGALGLGAALATSITAWLHASADPRMTQIAGQVEAISVLQHHIDEQLAAVQSHPAIPATNIVQKPALLSSLPPLPTVHVKVLPAVPAVPMLRPPSAHRDDGYGAAADGPAHRVAATPAVRPAPATHLRAGPADEPPFYVAHYGAGVLMAWPAVYADGPVYAARPVYAGMRRGPCHAHRCRATW